MTGRVLSLSAARVARLPSPAEQARIRAREHAESIIHGIDRHLSLDDIGIEIQRMLTELRRAEGML